MPPVMIANWVFFGKTHEHPCARGLCTVTDPALPTPCADGRGYRLFEWVAAHIVLFGAMLFLLYDKDAAGTDERHIESSLAVSLWW